MGTVSDLSYDQAGDAITTGVGDSGTVRRHIASSKPLLGAYVSLLLFMVVYFARPEDWIPGLAGVPLAKIAGVLALLAFVFSLGQIRQRLPREIVCLILLTVQLFLAASLSPVWPGGAFFKTLDFAKVLLIVIVMALSVRTEKRLRQLMFVQAVSVAVIAAIAIWKGRLLVGRLEGVLKGNYANPNDLALAIAISLPLCLALLLLSKWPWKVVWTLAMLVMIYAVFLTGSRGGFISLLVAAAVCLWQFAIRGRRRFLLLLAGLVGVVLWQSSSKMLSERLIGTVDPQENVASAYGSAQQREELFWRSVEVTEEHPLVGVGPGNFQGISGSWQVTHNSYTEMSSEGGIPALVLYVLILWYGFKNVAATKRLVPKQRELALLAYALHASLAGFIAGALFGSEGYEFFPFFLVAYTTALNWIARRSASRYETDKRGHEATPENELHANTIEHQMSRPSC